ncbi:MAG: PAC2 family protein [Thermoplasmatota archaeon]
MAWEFTRVRSQHLGKSLLLVTAPSYGMVGPVASRYLIDRLKLQLIGIVTEDGLPPTSVAWHGVVSGPIQLWHVAGPFGTRGEHEGLAILNVDVPLRADQMPPFSTFVMSLAREQEVGIVASIEGFPVEDSATAFRYAANFHGEDLAKTFKGEPVHGAITGLGAALLVAGNRAQRPALALFAPALDEAGDPGAAAKLLEAVQPLVPHARLDAKALELETAGIERKLREDRERQTRDSSRIQREVNRGYV